MPFTLNGIGTSNYGKRDFRADGSYITTEWFVLVFVPIFPLKSRRIQPTGRNRFLLVFYSSEYLLLEKLPLNGKQVASVYGWYAALWAFSGLTMVFPPIAILVVATCFAPWWLRKRARARIEQQVGVQPVGTAPQ